MKNIETFFKLVRNLFFSTFALIFMLMNSASANINALVIDKNNLNKTKVFTIPSELIKTLSPENSVKIFKPLLCDINRVKSSSRIFLKKLDCYVSERNFPLLRNVILELNPEQIRAILPDIVDGKDKLETNDSTKLNKNILSWNVSFPGDSNLLNLFINYSKEMKRKNLMKDFFNSNDVIFYKNKDDKILFRLNSYASSLVKFLKILKDNNVMPITVEDHLDLLDAFAKNYMENVRNRDEGIEDNTGLNVVIKNVLSNPIEGLNTFSFIYKIVENHLVNINQIGWKLFYITRCLDTHHVKNTTQTQSGLPPIFVNTEINQFLIYDKFGGQVIPYINKDTGGFEITNPLIGTRVILGNLNNNNNNNNNTVRTPLILGNLNNNNNNNYNTNTVRTPLTLDMLNNNPYMFHSINQPTQYSLCIGAGYANDSCALNPGALK